jgi:hypothetical protein
LKVKWNCVEQPPPYQVKLIAMSRPASSGGDGFEVVVDSDGTLSVPAAEMARHGFRPGTHLRLVSDEPQPAKRKSMRGAYVHLVEPADVDAFERAMAEAKSERIGYVESQLDS